MLDDTISDNSEVVFPKNALPDETLIVLEDTVPETHRLKIKIKKMNAIVLLDIL